MASVNTVVLSGRVAGELREIPSTPPGVELRLAFKNPHRAGFVSVSCFGPVAQIVRNTIVRGTPVRVVGRLRFDEWTNGGGQQRSALRITADTVQALPKSKGDEPTEPAPDAERIDEGV